MYSVGREKFGSEKLEAYLSIGAISDLGRVGINSIVGNVSFSLARHFGLGCGVR